MVQNPISYLGFNSFSIFFFAIVLISLCKPSLSIYEPDPDQNPPTVYEILAQYGLPSGLLPDSVTGYTLSDDGLFVVELAKPCYVEFEYLVYYEKKITGKLGYGFIKDLEGIQVQRFFFWLDVNEIKTDLPPSDSIYFQVGIINKKLKADQFKTVHSCRKGVSGSCKDSLKRFIEFHLYSNRPLPQSLSLDVHDLLPKYGFPKGLLPANVKYYNLSNEAAFTIELEEPCYVQFEKLVFYDRKITGKLKYGSVSEVGGIQAKLGFIWLPVSAIKVDSESNMLEFFVGFISKKFPAKQFAEIHHCRHKTPLLIDLMHSI